ncbi:MAG: FAD-dependent oxidoreductase, partial [Actinomycetota bacterium]|nr:FAD-dependent oxidoreductase [Actinomycetota bacterium]
LDHLFVEPIGPLEEQVFPVLTGLLEDWRAWWAQQGRAVHVVGPNRDPGSHAVCDFLARNVIQYRFLDAEGPVGMALLEEAGASAEELPLVLLEGGERLARPSMLELANAMNLATTPKQEHYDLIVIGGGPAGLGAAVYGSSEGLSTLLLETDAPGGQAGQSSRIENYLGFPAGLKGGELAQRALLQALRFGTEVVRLSDATALECAERGAAVRLADGTELGCRAAVIATGVTYRRLEAPGIERLLGRGIYYGAAATDAQSYDGRRVFIVGGANSAGQAALHFARHAGSVTMLVRAGSLEARMSRYLVERIARADNIEVLTRTEVTGASGDKHLERLTLSGIGEEQSREAPADVMFVFIGAVPHTEWLSGVARDDGGYVLSGREIDRERAGWSLGRDPLPLETNLPGVFAAGDVRSGSIKRVASAVGEGAMAVQLVHDYLAEQDGLL